MVATLLLYTKVDMDKNNIKIEKENDIVYYHTRGNLYNKI